MFKFLVLLQFVTFYYVIMVISIAIPVTKDKWYEVTNQSKTNNLKLGNDLF